MEEESAIQNPFPYALGAPTNVLSLGNELEEVSGITLLPNGMMAAIQDEEGYVYYLNPSTGEVADRKKFGKNGDYEDIAYANGLLYVLESDGDLHWFPWEGGEAEKIENDLETDNDTEGLCYHADSQQLWIACKEDAGLKGKKIKDTRSVYAWSLREKKLFTKPILQLNTDYLSELAQAKVQFKPSGIALHPITSDIYLISSVGKLLLVLDPAGQEVKHLQSLDYSHFPQPEGICFSANGTLWISTENKNNGLLVQLDYKP